MVTLANDYQRSSQAPQVYESYLKLVSTLCDNYMQQAGPDWRERSYVTDLYKVLAISKELDNNHKRSVAQSDPKSSVSPTVNPSNAHHGSPTSPDAIGSMTPPNCSPSTMTSKTSISFAQSHASESFNNSPNSSASLSSPSSSFSVTTNADAICCQICPATFTGQSQKTNFERHMRTTKRHRDGIGLSYRIEGCKSILSRSDNMGKHLRTVHHIDIPSRSQGTKKRRRSSDVQD